MRLLFLSITLLLSGIWTSVVYAQQINHPLSEIRAINSLSEEEFGQGRSVQLEAMTMYCTKKAITRCMLRDQTGAMLIESPEIPLEPGMVVSIEGRAVHEKLTEWDGGYPKIEPGATIQILRQDPLPEPLKTVRDARSITLEEAALAYPVHLRGIVTYCSYTNKRGPVCFFQDETGGIVFAIDENIPEYGSLVEIYGLTMQGWFGPDIKRGPSLKVIAKEGLPAPSEQSIAYFLKGKEDAKWVEVEGFVEGAYLTDEMEHTGLLLEISSRDDKPLKILVNHDDVPRGILASLVRVQGAAAGMFNGNRQLIGLMLRVPSIEFVQQIDTGIEDPFSELDRRPLNNVLAFSPNPKDGHMIHAGGVVTYIYPEGALVIQDDYGAMHVNAEATVEIGDTVQVAGFPKFGDKMPFIENAIVRSLGKALHPPKPVPQRLDSVALLNKNGLLVELEATLEEIVELGEAKYFMLRSDSVQFEAKIDKKYPQKSFREGSVLALTGVIELMFNPLYDDVPEIRPLILHLRNEQDIQVVKQGPWWTASHTRWFAAGLALTVVLVTSWVVLLRRQINEQTEEINAKNLSLSAAYEEAQVINDNLIETNRILENSMDQLRDALESNKEILGITAHDLKNPLGGIIGLAEMVIEDFEHGVKSTYESAVDNIPLLKDEAERMLKIIKELLDKYREGEDVSLNKESVILGDIVSSVIRWNQKQAISKEIKLHSHVEELVLVVVDIMAIQRVLDNYVSNAIKYSPSQSNVWIDTERMDAEGDQGSYVKVSVTDEGPGLTSEDKQKAFGKMQRLSAKPTAGEHSSGLGLYIVKQLVNAHEGSVGVESKEGEGATFWFTLPVEQQQYSPPGPRVTLPPVSM